MSRLFTGVFTQVTKLKSHFAHFRYSSVIAMSQPRFDIYVKAASDGKSVGDCPFSQRVNMYARLKIPAGQFTIIPVDIINKTDDFLGLSPEGKVPVLVDRDTDKVFVDSAAITQYIHEKFPEPDLQQDYDGPAVKASSGVFGKLAALLKNSDPDAIPQLRQALEDELRTLAKYLRCPECKGKFLVSDDVCELDCAVLPKLRHVQVAGKHYQDFEIPADCKAVKEYIARAEKTEVFKQTCPPDDEIIKGWARHNIMVLKK